MVSVQRPRCDHVGNERQQKKKNWSRRKKIRGRETNKGDFGVGRGKIQRGKGDGSTIYHACQLMVAKLF